MISLHDDRRWPYRISGYAALQSTLDWCAGRQPGAGWGALRRLVRLAAHPKAVADRMAGREDFNYPGTYAILDLVKRRPDVVHCHNLHGDFFDLRALAWLSSRVPTVLTLHDMWLLTGHCAYSLDCDRWATGCGHCPDLSLYPPIRKDATAFNWNRKRAIYADSRLAIAVPSEWMRRQVGRSMLAPAVSDVRVISNGVDLTVFHPADKARARVSLGLPATGAVVLITAGSRGSMWKDEKTVEAAVTAIARQAPVSPLFLAPGRDRRFASGTGADVRTMPYVTDAAAMARLYHTADVYVHAARADNFPTAVIEALACGTPVVATAVGGIVEQIRTGSAATGLLVPPADPAALARATIDLLADASLRHDMGQNAADDARARFDLERQADAYLEWYRDVVSAWSARV